MISDECTDICEGLENLVACPTDVQPAGEQSVQSLGPQVIGKLLPGPTADDAVGLAIDISDRIGPRTDRY